MIHINNKSKLEEIKLNKDNFYVVADFDKTLTEGSSNSTWGILADSGEIGSEYIVRRNELFKFYRPIEIDCNLSDIEKSVYMEKWWKEHTSLFLKYGLKEKNIKDAIVKSKMEFRDGAIEFLMDMNNKNVPVIIVSAGIGNIIELFLKEKECYFKNIHIISNFFEFENGLMKGILGETIHALNKNTVKLSQNIRKKLKNRGKILLLGDGLADLKMVSKEELLNTITVGFLDDKIDENLEYFNKEFDIVITDQGSFHDLEKILNIGG